MGNTEDVLVQILQRGLPKSEVDAQALIDKLQGKKSDESEEDKPTTSTSSRSSR